MRGCPDTVAKRIGRPRTRSVQSGQPEAAYDNATARLAMAAPPAAINAGALVPRARQRNGGRLRKTTIVAIARKLLVALWKYVTAGVVIDGAVTRAV